MKMNHKTNNFNVYKISILVFVLILPVENARILAVETVGAISHWNFMSAVLRSLTNAGHNITVFTPFPEGDRENYTEVDTSMDFKIKVGLDAMHIVNNFGSPIKCTENWLLRNRRNCDRVFKNVQLSEIIQGNQNSNFDVIIIEPLMYDCMSYISNAMNLSTIYLIPSTMVTPEERNIVGNMSNPSCVSHILAYQTIPKTFFQRFTNTFLLIYGNLKIIYDEFILKSTDPRSYDVSQTVNPSIIPQNNHYITEAPRPVSLNVIDVGGIHLKAVKSIPDNLLNFMEDSPHGIIYLTFGSTIELSSLPEQVENAFKKALARVPQKVLWKYKGKMKDKPKNVMTQKWFPQREVLLHPNTKLFISHGGISGVYEAVDAGVPVLGFPLFYDQSRNIDNLVLNGMAISLDLLTITEEMLLNTILELINNEKYMKNAIISSERFKDRPMSPEQLVVFWTEYVIRHGGVPLLESHTLTWYQYFLLDVISVVFIFTILILLKVYKVVKFCFY